MLCRNSNISYTALPTMSDALCRVHNEVHCARKLLGGESMRQQLVRWMVVVATRSSCGLTHRQGGTNAWLLVSCAEVNFQESDLTNAAESSLGLVGKSFQEAW